ncbi:MAG: hypothetical protein IJ511_02310 [Bacteroides sp.]|nr:hypothetical protein [Bacteroides sp.]
MKRFLFSLSLLPLLLSCQLNRNSNRDTAQAGSPMVTTPDEAGQKVPSASSIPVEKDPEEAYDTIAGDWTIRVRRAPNDVVITITPEYRLRDNSLFFTVEHAGQTVCREKELRTGDIVGSEGELKIYGNGTLQHLSSKTAYFHVSCFYPESDVGDFMLYCLSTNGETALYALTMEMGDECSECINQLSEFFTLYWHQRKMGCDSLPEMRSFLEHHCEPSFLQALERGEAHSIAQELFGEPTGMDYEQAIRSVDFRCENHQEGVTVTYSPREGEEPRAFLVRMNINEYPFKIASVEPCRSL